MEEVVIVNNESSGWGPIIFFIIVIIIVLILLAFLIWEHTGKITNVELGGNCQLTNECRLGLQCDRGQCREPIGGSCTCITDCVETATACFNGMCTNVKLSDIGGKPPCKPGLVNDHGICRLPVGGVCKKDNECVRGSYCSKGKCQKYNDFPDSSSSSDSSCESSSSSITSSSYQKQSSKESSDSKTLRDSSNQSSVYNEKPSNNESQDTHQNNFPVSTSGTDNPNESGTIDINSNNEESIASIYARMIKKRKYEFNI